MSGPVPQPGIFQSQRPPPPPPPANRNATQPMAQGAKARPPPPPLRLQQSAFGSTSRSRESSLTRDYASRDRDIATSPPGSGPNTPVTAQKLLYELPPSSAGPRRRAAQEQQERARTRATLQTKYRLQQANAISTKSLSDTESFSRHSRQIFGPGGAPADPDDSDLELASPTGSVMGRQSFNGPPSGRPRSLTPSHAVALMSPVRSDLEEFAQHCKAWLFSQDPKAGKAVEATFATIPPHQKAIFTKVQSGIRTAFHDWTSLRRLQDYRALLAGIVPGGSLSPAARSAPSSDRARKERVDRFFRFLKAYCLASAPGVHPFFEGLYGILRLQVLGDNVGGAGDHLIEWELDDAVFLESAGKEFSSEAIDILKGVLGFEEAFCSSHSEDSFMVPPNAEDSDTDSSLLEDNMPDTQTVIIKPSRPPPPSVPLRTRRSPSSATVESLSRPPIPHSSNSNSSLLQIGRGRASSDPFGDPSVVGSPGQSFQSRHTPLAGIGEGADDSSNTFSPALGTPPLIPNHSRHSSQPLPASPAQPFIKSRTLSTSLSNMDDIPPISPSYAAFQQLDFDINRLLVTLDPLYGLSYKVPAPSELDQLHNPQLRIWTFPFYLTNPEIQDLLSCFPSFITKKPIPRFHPLPKVSTPKKRKGDLEEGVGIGEEAGSTLRELRGEVTKGTGKMWISEKLRGGGYRGGLWARLMLWLKGMFG